MTLFIGNDCLNGFAVFQNHNKVNTCPWLVLKRAENSSAPCLQICLFVEVISVLFRPKCIVNVGILSPKSLCI